MFCFTTADKLNAILSEDPVNVAGALFLTLRNSMQDSWITGANETAEGGNYIKKFSFFFEILEVI